MKKEKKKEKHFTSLQFARVPKGYQRLPKVILRIIFLLLNYSSDWGYYYGEVVNKIFKIFQNEVTNMVRQLIVEGT